MDCACIEVDVDSSPSFYREVVQVARKIHRCGECNQIIYSGEKYEYFVGKWEGELSYHKTCTDCLSMRKAFFCTWYFSCIWDDLRAHLQHEYPRRPGECYAEALLQCTPKARERISEIMEGITSQLEE